MTTRQQIEEVLTKYRDMPRADLPDWLRNPPQGDETKFDLAFALVATQRGATPAYDDQGNLVEWQGFELKG